MPTVHYRDGQRPRFHKNQDCAQLTKAPARGTARPLVSVDLEDLPVRANPCKTCYPDFPNPKIVRRYCPICPSQTVRPCEHNGGVQVTASYTTNYVSALRDPGEETNWVTWVWPDHAWQYEQV